MIGMMSFGPQGMPWLGNDQASIGPSTSQAMVGAGAVFECAAAESRLARSRLRQAFVLLMFSRAHECEIGLMIWPFSGVRSRNSELLMSFRCIFLRHRPMFSSIVRREHGYAAFCDDCGLPIERTTDGRWTASEPLLSRRDRAA